MQAFSACVPACWPQLPGLPRFAPHLIVVIIIVIIVILFLGDAPVAEILFLQNLLGENVTNVGPANILTVPPDSHDHGLEESQWIFGQGAFLPLPAQEWGLGLHTVLSIPVVSVGKP